jgi:hypothetical protein
VGQHAQAESYFIGPEMMTRQPRHLHRLLAFFDPLLRRASLVVETDYSPTVGAGNSSRSFGTSLQGAYTCAPALVPNFTFGKKIHCRLDGRRIYFNDLIHFGYLDDSRDHSLNASETQGSTRFL